jgi:hypothetical protein
MMKKTTDYSTETMLSQRPTKVIARREKHAGDIIDGGSDE